MSGPRPNGSPGGKSFEIDKGLVMEAYRRVAANKGAPGVDEVSVADFERDLKNNLYKIWNRMSSGTYFPPPVRAVEIPKAHGAGVRVLGVPTVADRIAQTVSRRRWSSWCWSRWWSRCFTATLTATGRASRRMMRWRCAGGAASSVTG
jgi:hypothetical protein